MTQPNRSEALAIPEAKPASAAGSHRLPRCAAFVFPFDRHGGALARRSRRELGAGLGESRGGCGDRAVLDAVRRADRLGGRERMARAASRAGRDGPGARLDGGRPEGRARRRGPPHRDVRAEVRRQRAAQGAGAGARERLVAHRRGEGHRCKWARGSGFSPTSGCLPKSDLQPTHEVANLRRACRHCAAPRRGARRDRRSAGALARQVAHRRDPARHLRRADASPFARSSPSAGSRPALASRARA